jgi:hypothetical protein
MNSPWSRDHAEAPPAGFADPVEIELENERPARPARVSRDAEPIRPRHRALVLVAAAAVASAASVVAITALGNDDQVSTPPVTTVDPFLLSAAITTPPTLAPDDRPATTLDPPVTTAAATAPADTLPAAALVATDFEPVAVGDPAQLAAHDLEAAVAANAAGDAPARTSFRISGLVEAGDRPSIVGVTIASDPLAGRDSLSITAGASFSRTIVDRVEQVVYRSSPALPEGSWARFDQSEVLRDTDAADIDELFDSLVAGPVTPRLLAAAEIDAYDGLVRLGDGAVARRYDVTVGPEWIAPWGAMTFAASPRAVVTNRDGLALITFEVYVTDAPALALVISQFEVFGEPRAMMQFFEQRPPDVRIDLPDPADVIGNAAA